MGVEAWPGICTRQSQVQVISLLGCRELGRVISRGTGQSSDTVSCSVQLVMHPATPQAWHWRQQDASNVCSTSTCQLVALCEGSCHCISHETTRQQHMQEVTWPFHPACRAMQMQLAFGVSQILAPIALWVIVCVWLLQV